MKENSVPPTNLSRADSTVPSTAVTFLANKSPVNNVSPNSTEDVKTVVEVNNTSEQLVNIPDTQDVASDENEQNGVEPSNEKQST